MATEPATDRQVKFLGELGFDGDATTLSKSQAQGVITRLVAKRDADKDKPPAWAKELVERIDRLEHLLNAIGRPIYDGVDQ